MSIKWNDGFEIVARRVRHGLVVEVQDMDGFVRHSEFARHGNTDEAYAKCEEARQKLIEAESDIQMQRDMLSSTIEQIEKEVDRFIMGEDGDFDWNREHREDRRDYYDG